MSEAGEMVQVPRSEWEEMKARLDSLEQRVGSPMPAGGPAAGVDGLTDRRGLLKHGAMLAAAAAAGGTALVAVQASPAAATTGAMQFGATNDAGTDSTTLQAATSSAAALEHLQHRRRRRARRQRLSHRYRHGTRRDDQQPCELPASGSYRDSRPWRSAQSDYQQQFEHRARTPSREQWHRLTHLRGERQRQQPVRGHHRKSRRERPGGAGELLGVQRHTGRRPHRLQLGAHGGRPDPWIGKRRQRDHNGNRHRDPSAR